MASGGNLSLVKSFKVFGEPIDILTTGEMTNGRSCMLIQTSPPGGGPPPHSHQNEDETFYVLEGDFEIFSSGQWSKLALGEAVQGNRDAVHTFRNAGTTTGRMLIFASPAGLEKYLEEISVLSIPQDMPQILAISERYGIKFAL
jgi:quercetin dioxygenase-like cupin family protein